MLNISSVDRGAVVTKFVDFLWRIYGFSLWIYEDCLLRFGPGLQYGLGIEQKLVEYLKRKVFVEEKKGNCN